MKKFTLALLALLALLAFVPGAHAATVIGRLVTCPGGDPIVGAPVHLWFNGVWVNSATTGANGQYVAPAGPGSCDPLNSMITVTIGSLMYFVRADAISRVISVAVRPDARTSPTRGTVMLPSGRTITGKERSGSRHTVIRSSSEIPMP